jgi:exo-beta-1,3-glucanase (GH17 family)/cellulose synthase/poly-beta-1,6-N-acetylglucosamine synthase-like glycosyltransferase
MKLSSFIIASVFALITYGLWAGLNRPVHEPLWPERVQGMAFSPFRAGQDPAEQRLPSAAEIDNDLRLLADAAVNTVRTYSALGSLAEIPRLAEQHHIRVVVGAWLDRQRDTNRQEIEAAVDLAKTHTNVIRVIVGNETLLRGDLTVPELTAELDRVREAVSQPVSTAEPWHVWIKYPELAEHVDFIAVHLLPYWEGLDVNDAIDDVRARVRLLERSFPGKPVIIAEVGWPSDGRTRGAAVASTSNQALFLRRFLKAAEEQRYTYYLMEAFDQPWKARYEGAVGAYWGIYDVQRKPKFEFVAPIVRIPEWQILAVISMALAVLLLGFFYVHSRTLRKRGRSLLAAVIYGAATAAVLVIYNYSQRYLTFTSVIIGAVLIVGMFAVIAVLLAEAHEWAEAHWVTTRRRTFFNDLSGPHTAPRVSIHVPTYNEPPKMVIETLDALARLDYPDFEVIVVDNNTQQQSAWRPVAAHCQRLGGRFRFFHVDRLEGYKAGALNYALRHTSDDARIVAVIDSDYKVDPQWLADLVPGFENERVAIVQAPQDYRDAQQSAFKAMCYAEYRGFFQIGMITRNERNAIIQHGTMTLVRREALTKVGGWAQWCITEDAELGLRLFEHGYEAQYLPFSYGQGLIPETFNDYKRQRFRWAYGAIQILRQHAATLFSPGDSRLTSGQRYHFIAGWLPWMADGLNLIFNLAALGWSIAMIIAPQRIDPPLVMFSVIPLTLFTFKLVKLTHLYVTRVGANLRQTLAAAIAGLALSHTIGTAVLKSVFTRDEPFLRTPKHEQPRSFIGALTAAAQEILLLCAFSSAAFLLSHQVVLTDRITLGLAEEMKAPDVSVWIAVLLVQAIPYFATLVVSLISASSLPARVLGDATATDASVTPKQL